MKTNSQVLRAQARIGERIIHYKLEREQAEGRAPTLRTFASRVGDEHEHSDSPVVNNGRQAKPDGRSDIDPNTIPEFTRVDYMPTPIIHDIEPVSSDVVRMMTPPSTKDFIKRRGGR